jgi:hypothetical protein
VLRAPLESACNFKLVFRRGRETSRRVQRIRVAREAAVQQRLLLARDTRRAPGLNADLLLGVASVLPRGRGCVPRHCDEVCVVAGLAAAWIGLAAAVDALRKSAKIR